MQSVIGSVMLSLLIHLPCTTRIMILGQMAQALATKEWAKEGGLCLREAQCHLDAELFLDAYPQQDVGGSYCLIILQRMFVHATEVGQKEGERFICWGCWHGFPRPNPESNVPAIQLVEYQTSWKEIWDLYHEVYLLKKLPSPLPCGPKWMKEAIKDILCSLRSHLQRQGGTTMLEEDQRGAAAATVWPSCWTGPHSQSSQTQGRTTHVMRPFQKLRRHTSGLWRLPPCWSSILRGWKRKQMVPDADIPAATVTLWVDHGRDMWPFANLRKGHPQMRGPMTGQGRRGRQGYPPEPSIENYELCLGWQACQLDTPYWWEELTAIPEAGDVKMLAQKIHVSFDVPAVWCGALRNQDYTAPLAPKWLRRGTFLPNDWSYQDAWLKPWLLTLAYVWVLQYWAEEANSLASGKPHPLAMSVRELRWHVRRYTTFSESEIFEGLGNAIHKAEYGEWRLHQWTPLPPVSWLMLKTHSSVMWKLHQWMTPQYWWPNPMPRLKRTCQLPGVLALQNWKLQLVPLWYQWIGWPALPLWLAIQ